MDEQKTPWWLVVGGGVLVGLILVGLLMLGLLGIGGYVISSRARRGLEQIAATMTAIATTGPLQGYASNGETVYFTGVNDRGERIPFTGGPMWLSMDGGGCASCHRPNGRGGFPVKMGTEIPSDILYETLTSEEMEHGGEETHPPYTDETIKRAITEGFEPDGEPMDLTMPRWQMSERDLDDLLEFLKTLD